MMTNTLPALAATAADIAAEPGNWEGETIVTGHGFGETPARVWSAARFNRTTVLVTLVQDGARRTITVPAGRRFTFA